MRISNCTMAVAVMLALTWALGQSVAAQETKFSPSRVNITVPFAEGGGSDTLVRMIVPYLRQVLPNNPSVAVLNQPGGGGITGTNQFYRSAPKDGEALLAMSSSVFMANLLKDRQVRFKMQDFIPVYTSPLSGIVYVSDKTGAKAPGDVKGIGGGELVFGAASPTSVDVLTIIALDLLGVKVKPVFGTQRGAARIAFERGEFSVDQQTPAAYNANVAPLVKAGRAVPFLVFGFANAEGDIVRDLAFPEIQTFFEIYKSVHGKDISGPPRRAWLALFNASVSAGKALVLPPATPEPIVEAYVEAFKQVLSNPAYLERAKLEIGDYPQMTGAEAKKQFSSAATLDEEAFEWLADWYKKKLGVTLAAQ